MVTSCSVSEEAAPVVKSPCILVCSIDTATGYCFGCGRTRDEIAAWTSYTDAERDAVMATLPDRLATVVRPPRRETKRRRIARLRDDAESNG